jgi:hypothetical protein
MNRRNTIAVVIIFIVALGAWRLISRRDGVKTVPPAIPASVTRETASVEKDSPSTNSLRERLGWEEDRLARLQKTLADVETNQVSALQAASQVQELSARLNDTRLQLRANQDSQSRLESDARTFRRQSQMASKEAEIALESQLQSVNDAIFDLQIQFQNAQASGIPAASPLFGDLRARLTGLERQKNQLMSQIRLQDLAAQTEQLQAEQDASDLGVEVHTERQNLLRQQADLRTALEYWQKQQQALDSPTRSDRIQSLRNQVLDQQKRVARLQNKIY